ncbi:hypothetical protein [Legionella spiritensis]|uniref:hypothetical protein n=1 Tax=Legionella spiritensis TaxID=452 RepID=UPI000F6E1E2B|nr:hypothetical protein [Legionella spiritensis]VEG89636.1 Uncharacterised protein [Legionella spiritensis]
MKNFQQSPADIFHERDVDARSVDKVRTELDWLTCPEKNTIKKLIGNIHTFLSVTHPRESSFRNDAEEAYLDLLNTINEDITTLENASSDPDRAIALTLDYVKKCLINQLHFIQEENPESLSLKWYASEKNNLKHFAGLQFDHPNSFGA